MEWNNNVYSFLDTDHVITIIRHIQTQSVAAKSMTAFMSVAALLTNQRQSTFVRQWFAITCIWVHCVLMFVNIYNKQ